MPVEIRVPALGESVVDATISRWLKHEGDSITAGEAVVELETDKVNVEVPADQGGILRQIVKQEGDTVGIGDVIAVVDADGAGQPASAPSAGQASAPASQAAPPTQGDDSA